MTDEPDLVAMARRAVRVRALSDPLGTKGFRRTAARLDREQRARQTVFGLTLAAFVAIFWLLAGARHAPDPAPVMPVAQPTAADVPASAGNEQPTIYRYVEQPPHVVTRTS